MCLPVCVSACMSLLEWVYYVHLCCMCINVCLYASTLIATYMCMCTHIYVYAYTYRNKQTGRHITYMYVCIITFAAAWDLHNTDHVINYCVKDESVDWDCMHNLSSCDNHLFVHSLWVQYLFCFLKKNCLNGL